ncbi:MAG: hypothetical protein KME55_23685 [Nostoc indistinguendum CM1-VF10]|nr:hypothetical protein [Nostoc indistinguendum CM1-VF10]
MSSDEADNFYLLSNGKFYLKSHTILGVTSNVLPGDRRDIANNTQFDDLPPIKLIPLNDEAVSMAQPPGRDRPAKIAAPTDIRWIKVLEFLHRSSVVYRRRHRCLLSCDWRRSGVRYAQAT